MDKIIDRFKKLFKRKEKTKSTTGSVLRKITVPIAAGMFMVQFKYKGYPYDESGLYYYLYYGIFSNKRAFINNPNTLGIWIIKRLKQ